MSDYSKLSKRQKHILQFMQQHNESHGFPPTIREIGEATSINSTSVVNYNLNKLVKEGFLERSSKVSRGLRLVKQAGDEGNVLIHPASQVTRIPLIGQIVASAPVSVPDDIGYYFDEDSTLEITPSLVRGADMNSVFALRVKGESMIDAMINDGDIVILRKQQTAHDGDMVAVWLDERSETTLKHFFDEGTRIRLQPAHPAMDPIYVHPNHCRIQGKVLTVIRYCD